MVTLQDEERAQRPSPGNLPAPEPPGNAVGIPEGHGFRLQFLTVID